MDHLRAFLKRYGQRRTVRSWLGPRPDVRIGALPRAIGSTVGCPVSAEGWPEEEQLTQIDLRTATQLLAFTATRSLAFGRDPPRESYRKEAEAALADFEPGAVFLTNTADWTKGGPVGWSIRLTNAALEAGLIAYDAKSAMIFWVEEDV